MRVIRGVLGVLVILVGVLWIGQGVGLVPGSIMTGHPIYAVLGLLCILVGAWVLNGVFRRRVGGIPRR